MRPGEQRRPEFQPDGRLRYGLHGKMANIPAHKVEVAIDGDSGRIAIRGTVEEARLFGGKLRLETSIETQVGRPGLAVHDTVTNLSAAASDFELLYHINFGVPLVQPGAKVSLPVKKLAPRDAVPSPICRPGTVTARRRPARRKFVSSRNRPATPTATRRSCFTIPRRRRA